MLPSTQPDEIWLDKPLKRWIPANFETLLISIILILAVVSRFYDLGARTISFDEVNHVVPSYDLYQGRGYRYDPLSHGPLQFHMMAFSYFLFGDSDFSARVPAAVFSVATVAVALIAFRRYLGRIGALAAGIMFLISPFILFYGRYARNEAYVVVWGLLTIYTILRYLERGEKWVLFLYTAVNAFHFTDKATSYIFAAEQLIFLTFYLVDRLTRREWLNPKYRQYFLATMGLMVALLAAALGFYLKFKPLEPAMKIVMACLAGGGLAATVAAVVMLVRGLGWAGLRFERAFDLIMLLGTLILPLLAALPVKLMGSNPLDYSRAGILRAVIVIATLGATAVALGLWWNRRWLVHAALFYSIFTVLYSTFFTNPQGLAGGFMGALGYWMEQQAVNRGSQPWFYYGLFLVPIYEFLPALGTMMAVIIAGRKRLWQAQPGQPFQPALTTGAAEQPAPTAALCVYWSLSSLGAFTVAGEKMPWLTVNIALPMILTAGWAVGWLVGTIPWGKVREWNGWSFTRAVVLAVFGLLAVLTARSAFRAAYINYDYPYEYMVYAHTPSDPKILLTEIDAISRRTAGGEDLVIAYDNNVRYPYWWYLRHYPNRVDFNITPTRDLRRAAVIMVSPENYAKVAPIVRDNYYEFQYMRLWWPNQDYMSLKWSAIDSERKAELGLDATTMTVFDYLKYSWRHIEPFFMNANVRDAVWQIWLDRDYTEYAAMKKSDTFTLTNWGVAERMTFFVRRDIVTQMWSHGAEGVPVAEVTDPYAVLTVPVVPDLVLGSTPGQFQSPRSVAVAPDGSLYVADARNHRIQHLSPSGEVLQVWGSQADAAQGAAPGGTFNEPWGVAVGPDGNVYVADTWNHRIQKFTADGQFVTMWGRFGQGDAPDAFYGPRGIAVDALGRVYVADTGNKRIAVFDADGNFLTQFGSPGFGSGQLDEPVGVAVGTDGRVYVADTWNQRVQVFAPDGTGLYFTPLAEWPVDGWNGQSLENKPFIAVDTQGQVYVSDPESCRVVELSPQGQALRVWGSCDVPGGFVLPDGVATDSAGGLWVSDAGAGTLLHFRVENP